MKSHTSASKLQSKSKDVAFVWHGTDQHGRQASGEVTASAARLVPALLRRQGIVVSSVAKKRTWPTAFAGGFGDRIKGSDIAVFSRQLATMMAAGVPLLQAFDIVASGTRSARFAGIVRDIREDIAAGSTLASALAKHPAQFDDLYRSLVHVGELSGTLDVMLERIAAARERAEATRRKVKKALIYPTLVVVAALLITALLLIYVVPQFEVVFAAAGAELPAFTRFVIKASEAMQAWWPAVLGGILAAGIGFTVLKKRWVRFRDALDSLALKLPVVGSLLANAATARCAGTLATAMAAGVPMLDALRAVADATVNAVYVRTLRRVCNEVAGGQPLSECLRNGGLFPDMMVQMVAVGEESGSLEEMLARVAEQFEAEVSDATDHLAALMEPLLMLVLGVLVGGLVLAMYLPVFQLGDTFG